MVTKVKATEDFWLLNNADHIVRRIAKDALVAFSINKLRELKLVTANFKNGFDFSDSYYIRYDLKKFYKLLITAIYKAVPFLPSSTSYFSNVTSSSRPSFRIYCEPDHVMFRYMRRLQGKANGLGLPYELHYNRLEGRVEYLCNVHSSESAMSTYKLLMLAPDALTILKTLSRKAIFTDEQLRTYTRSERTGWPVPV